MGRATYTTTFAFSSYIIVLDSATGYWPKLMVTFQFIHHRFQLCNRLVNRNANSFLSVYVSSFYPLQPLKEVLRQVHNFQFILHCFQLRNGPLSPRMYITSYLSVYTSSFSTLQLIPKTSSFTWLSVYASSLSTLQPVRGPDKRTVQKWFFQFIHHRFRLCNSIVSINKGEDISVAFSSRIIVLYSAT